MLRATAAAVLALAALATAQSRPEVNVIYILADDLGYGELGCFGQTKIKTPHLDRLAREGMRFTRHYCGAPVCAPSRCVLMTGRHLGHATIRDNKEVKPEGQTPIRAEDTTLGELMRKAGYRTAAIGKWGLGPVGSSGDPNAQGFDLFYGYNCQRVAHSYYPPHLWRNGTKEIINEKPVPGHHRPKDGATIDFASYVGENYAPDLMLKVACEFVTESAKAGKPFFLYFAPVEPHVAMQPPQEWVDRYPKEWDAEPYRGDRGYLPHARPRAAYAAMISDLDEHVGTLMRTLEELGIGKDTLVMFSSDNGPTHPRGPDGDVGGVDTRFFKSKAGLRGHKGSVYEGGIRVPAIARWPGKIEAGSTTAHVSAFYDVMPTLAELTGVACPETDGLSFLPTLLGQKEKQKVHEFLLWEFHGYGGQQALIFGDWKLVRQGLKRRRQTTELFDLKGDPFETKDVAAEHLEEVRWGLRVLAEQHLESGVFEMGNIDGR